MASTKIGNVVTLEVFILTTLSTGIMALLAKMWWPNEASFVPQVLSILGGLCIIFTVIRHVVRISEEQFGVDLEKLRETLELSWKEFVGYDSLGAFQPRAGHRLIYLASLVKYAEEKYSINSKQASDNRAEFNRAHAICLKFGIAESKWNPYYDAVDLKVSPIHDNDKEIMERATASTSVASI